MKIKHLLCYFLLTVGIMSHAEFYQPDDVGNPWGKIIRSEKKSVVKFEVLGAGRCSGVKISNQGHVLTAMHCFESCLRAKAFYNVLNIENEMRTDYYAIIDQTRLPICDIRFKDYAFDINDDFINEPKIGEAKVLATGVGKILLNPTNPNIDSIFDFYSANKKTLTELRNVGVGRIIGDFVVFQSDSFISNDCSQVVKDQSIKSPRELLSISFPNYTFSRSSGVNPNGRSQYVSLGKVSDNGILSSSSLFVKSLLDENEKEDVRLAYTHKNYAGNDDIIWANYDALSGSSGSPTFTMEAKVFSLTTFNICDQFSARHQGCQFSSGGVRISKIVNDLKFNFSQEKINSFFECVK